MSPRGRRQIYVLGFSHHNKQQGAAYLCTIDPFAVFTLQWMLQHSDCSLCLGILASLPMEVQEGL